MERIKRAQFFTIDAFIALSIIIITIIAISPTLKQSRQEPIITADVLESLGSLSIGEFNNSYAKQLIIEGKVSDPSNSLLEQIGEFYVTNKTIAKLLATETLSSLSEKENIGIWYGSTLLASKNVTPFETAENVFTDRQIISGIGGDSSSVTGFSTRAYLSSSSRTQYSYFGGYVGEGNITTSLEYQGTIKSADIELVINNDFEIFVNGNSAGTFSSSPNELTPVAYNFSTADFNSGNNLVEIRGDTLHITGGFIKISYETNVTYEQPTRYHFPGIKGIINLYDGLYIPGNLTKLSIYLHFNNTLNTFLTIGNTQIFNASSDGTPITISDATLAGLLNYSDISKKTIPIRFGVDDMSYVINTSKDIDVFSVTDLSGSMCYCTQRYSTCCGWSNDGCRYDQQKCEACGYVCTAGIYEAKSANNAFIDMITNSSGDRVGLVGYESNVDVADTHVLSSDNVSLKNEVSQWFAKGGTCICCGVNEAVNRLVATSPSSNFRSIVVMSDGEATVECPSRSGDHAKADAIQAACNAYNNHGIIVYAVAFGANADESTLTQMASCGGGSFYSAVGDLTTIYQSIAAEIIATAFYEQTVIVLGTFFSELYPDSYIEFDYEQETPPTGLITTIEESFSTPTNATFSIPINSTILEATAISYSGSRWTALVKTNNEVSYNLSEYGKEFLQIGDPYSINIPPSQILEDNSLSLQTVFSSGNMTEGSIFNKVIYTISKELASYTSVSSTATGCNWKVQFNSYNLTLPIPSNYTGSENCEYSVSSYCGIYPNCAGATDSTQIATFNLFKLLDFNLDGKVDVDLSTNDMQISTSDLEGVPFLYSTEVQIRKWY
jgi:hypothetical protein